MKQLLLSIGCLLILGLGGCVARTPSAPLQAVESTSEIALPTLGRQPVQVTAALEPLQGEGLRPLRSSEVVRLVESLAAAEPSRSYLSSDFAPLLPQAPVSVGEVWVLPSEEVCRFLKQLHPAMTAHLDREGEGAYALIRARSETKLEIAFRIHAQFKLGKHLLVTPGQFDGTLIVDTASQSVQYFRLALPTDRTKNVNYELLNSQRAVGMVLCPRMELAGGENPESAPWLEEIDESESRHLLAKQYFALEELTWVPFEQALAQAEATSKPIFCIVIEGVLTDQSC